MSSDKCLFAEHKACQNTEYHHRPKLFHDAPFLSILLPEETSPRPLNYKIWNPI